MLSPEEGDRVLKLSLKSHSAVEFHSCTGLLLRAWWSLAFVCAAGSIDSSQ